jgi:hypothetical protein
MENGEFVWWWLRDFEKLPNNPEQLVEHAKIIHAQARALIADTMFWCGCLAVLPGVLLIGALTAGIIPGRATDGSIGGGIMAFIMAIAIPAILGAFAGRSLARGRAFRFRATAAIALSLARIEEQLQSSGREWERSGSSDPAVNRQAI